MLSQKHLTKKTLGHFLDEEKKNLFLSLLVCTHLPHLFNKYLLSIFFYEMMEGRSYFQMRKPSFQKNASVITFVTTRMSCEIVHVNCLLQCSAYNRPLVKKKQQFLFVLCYKSYCLFLFLLTLLPSPLSFLPSPPPPSTNSLLFTILYIYFFIYTYRIINEYKSFFFFFLTLC